MTSLPDTGAHASAASPPETPAPSDARTPERGTARLLSRPVRWVVAGLALVALFDRLALLGRSLTALDRIFIPDDTYYTLAIAKSLAEGNGPSGDGGETLTTGFQPLIAFLMVPVHWFSDDPGVPVRAVLGLLSVADVATVVLLALLAARVAGGVAAVTAAALWALSPLPVAIAMNGLEASLALALSLALVEAWCRARERETTAWWVLVGVLAGVCLLARVDTVFLVGALGVIQLLSRQLRGLFVAVPAALVTVLPWWITSIVIAGSPVPESGGAVGELVDFHRSLGLSVADSLGMAGGRLIGAPVKDLPGIREWLVDNEVWAVTVAGLLCVLMLAAGAWWALSRRRDGAVSTLPMLALGVHGAAILLFYGIVNAAPWFYDRYLLPSMAVLTLIAATVVGDLCRRAGLGAPRDAQPLPGRAVARPLAAVALAGCLVLLGTAVSGTVHFYRLQPESTVAVGYDGAKGYAEIARDLLDQVPDGSVVGSLQTGALSYFAQYGPDVEVVNLDGVVDGDAAEALAEHRLADYARERGITHFTDWALNHFLFFERSDASVGPLPEFEPVYTAANQGGDVFTLYRVVWPEGDAAE